MWRVAVLAVMASLSRIPQASIMSMIAIAPLPMAFRTTQGSHRHRQIKSLLTRNSSTTEVMEQGIITCSRQVHASMQEQATHHQHKTMMVSHGHKAQSLILERMSLLWGPLFHHVPLLVEALSSW